ncbi:hypothetical protein Patl1_15847 [Pistacia atlantica]|uniref:Uncharacterized protein n=1 Tax=Pistacia atlantica TaxID=434234 RepID=A0ACC1B8P4_9ROSI|nr:hypothetical protein Patl1_15847 [Pistacia atlantica]
MVIVIQNSFTCVLTNVGSLMLSSKFQVMMAGLLINLNRLATFSIILSIIIFFVNA